MSVATAPAPAEAGAEPKKKGKGKLIIIVVLLLVLGGGGAYWFVLKPKDSGKPPPPVAGEVVTLEPIQINLSGEHYLRVGIALQMIEGAEKADGSKALDATIDEFSGLPIAEIEEPKKRRELKKELEKELEHLYEKEVMGVYFTEFVTQ